MHFLPVPPAMRIMHSMLNTSSQAPVSGEKKKGHLQERVAGPCPLFSFLLIGDPHPTAECAGKKDPAQYLLTVKQMIENDYPVSSYLADVLEKPDE